jgi:hypothetical protein
MIANVRPGKRCEPLQEGITTELVSLSLPSGQKIEWNKPGLGVYYSRCDKYDICVKNDVVENGAAVDPVGTCYELAGFFAIAAVTNIETVRTVADVSDQVVKTIAIDVHPKSCESTRSIVYYEASGSAAEKKCEIKKSVCPANTQCVQVGTGLAQTAACVSASPSPSPAPPATIIDQPVAVFCTDSEGQKNYYLKGSVTSNYQGWNPNQPVYDTCATGSEGSFQHQTSCTGATCHVVEYYCTGTVPGAETQKCVGGCSNGACLVPDFDIGSPGYDIWAPAGQAIRTSSDVVSSPGTQIVLFIIASLAILLVTLLNFVHK